MPFRRSSRTALATLVCFFALAATAHAECAWVLWHRQDMWQVQGPSGPVRPDLLRRWFREAAYDSKTACTAGALAALTLGFP